MRSKAIRFALSLMVASVVVALAPSVSTAAASRPWSHITRPPLPSPLPAVMHESCPGLEDVAGCYIGPGEADVTERLFDHGAVFVAPGGGLFTKLHEMGHAFDRTMMDAQEREEYTALRHSRDLMWTWSEGIGDVLVSGMGTPEEDFADAYASCRMKRTPYGLWESGYAYYPRPREHYRICRMIARAGRDAGQAVAADGSR